MTFETVKKSVMLLKKYPIVYLPDIVFIAINSLLIYIFYTVTGIGDILPLIEAAESLPFEILQNYFSENSAKLIISGILFGIVTFIIGVGVQVVKFSIIDKMLHREKITIKKAWNERKRYFWDIVVIRIFVFLLSLAAVIAIGFASAIVYLLVNLILPALAISTTTVVAVLLTIALILIVKLSIQFRFAILFLEKRRNGFQVLKRSFSFFQKYPGYTFVAFLFILLIAIMVGLIAWVVNIALSIPGQFITVTGFVVVMGVLSAIINRLIILTGELWGQIFLFKKYKDKK